MILYYIHYNIVIYSVWINILSKIHYIFKASQNGSTYIFAGNKKA